MTAVVGLDLSLTGTGVATTSGTTFTIRTSFKRADARLEDIYTTINGTLIGAEYAVLEDLPVHAKQAGTTGMVQGVARLALIRKGIPYALLSPATLKKFATGKGNADKADMAAALLEHLGNPVVEVDAKGKQFLPQYGVELSDDNQVDAAWLRLAGLTRFGLGYDTILNDRLDVLDKGKWAERKYAA